MAGASSRTPAEQLATPVQFMKGVGPERALLLERLGLRTARDVLFHFPRSYQDMSELREGDELIEDRAVSVCGTVSEIELRGSGPGRSVLGVLVKPARGHVRAVWFNQAFLRKKFQTGQRVLISGIPRQRGLCWEMAHPKVEWLEENEQPPAGEILPVYGLTDGLTQAQMRRIAQTAVENYAPLLDEVFPEDFLDAHQLWPIQAALPQIHLPSNRMTLDMARRRFIYQELLVLQLALALRRQRLVTGRKAPPLPANPRIEQRIERVLGVTPTDDQRQAMKEIAADMGRDYPMNRLLQGDVGSGKTLVAQFALLLAVAHGFQAALMAPTEVLARQHARTLGRNLAESRVRIGLLTGSLAAAERRELLERIARGEVDLIIGTHAVVHAIGRSQTQFSRLGLVVIDEQHKFGVRQRALLKQAGLSPHYLVMTATPIPRTVSMTLFGDLDVSVLRRPPPGRQPVHSYLVDEGKRDRWWDFFRKKLREGRQAYVIAPRVDDPTAASDELNDPGSQDESDGEWWLNGVERPPASTTAAEWDESLASACSAADGESAERTHVPVSGDAMLSSRRPEEIVQLPPNWPGIPIDSARDASSLVTTGRSGSGGSDVAGSDHLESGTSSQVRDGGDDASSAAVAASVEQLFEALTNGPLADFRLDIVHGRMSAAEKDDAMRRFRDGQTQVLVATSVVEVGVDVPNATLMTIENAEQFGLAQLHQLRGRVSRGTHPGYVAVFADPKTDESRARLSSFVSTSDGFELAERDFQLRGPGDLFGTKQHGLPPLRMADLQRDTELLIEARADAQRLITADPSLADPSFARLRRMVLVRYGEALELVDVG